MSELIHYSCNEGIATLILNNGKVNAISPDMIAAFNSCLDQAEQDRAIVIITGQPGILSGGYDLKVMTSGPENAINLVAAGSTLARRMLAHPYPIIVACSGHAIAKGAFLLLSADYRIGVEGPFNIGLNEVLIGMTMHHAGIRSEERRVGKECRARVSAKYSSRRRHTRCGRDWSSDVCSSDLLYTGASYVSTPLPDHCRLLRPCDC